MLKYASILLSLFRVSHDIALIPIFRSRTLHKNSYNDVIYARKIISAIQLSDTQSFAFLSWELCVFFSYVLFSRFFLVIDERGIEGEFNTKKKLL